MSRQQSRIAILVVSLLLWTGCAAFAQPNRKSQASEPCLAVSAANLADLERRRLTLEQTAAALRARTETLASTTSAGSEALTRAQQELARNQASLIDVLYKLECLRSDLQQNSEVLRGAGTTLTMSLFYATNRQPTDSRQASAFYGADDTRRLTYGTTSISIPSLHKAGELELPTLWKLERNPSPERHFLVGSVTPLDSAEAKAQISAALATARSKSLLVFVHGYNVSFREASFRTAQLAHDLRFPGVVMFYSWPSAGAMMGYLHDVESSQLSKAIFDQLLDDLSALKFEDIYVVAHSLGNRVVGGTIADRVQGGKDVSQLREIMLAAPDINVEIFKSEIAPKLAGIKTATRTIYASSKDVALKASSVVHAFPRVGDTKAGVFVYSGFDTIDATATAPMMRSFGHSYVLDSTIVLNDVEDVVVWRRPPAERTLRRMGTTPNLYWSLR